MDGWIIIYSQWGVWPVQIKLKAFLTLNNYACINNCILYFPVCSDLCRVGGTLPGHQRKSIGDAQDMKQQMSQTLPIRVWLIKKNTCWASRLATNSHLKSKPDWDNPKKANGKLLEPTIAWRANGNLYIIWDSVAPLPRILWKTTACPMENCMGLTGTRGVLGKHSTC